MSFAFDGISGGGLGSRAGLPSFSNPSVHGPPTCPVNNAPKFGDPTFVGPPTKKEAPSIAPKFGDPTFVGPPTIKEAPKLVAPTFVGPPACPVITAPTQTNSNNSVIGGGNFGLNLDGTAKGGLFEKTYNSFFPSTTNANSSFIEKGTLDLAGIPGSSNFDVYGNVNTGAPSVVYNDGINMVNFNGSSKSISVRHIEDIGGVKVGTAGSFGAKGANAGIVTRDGDVIKECGVGVDTNQGWKNEAYGYCKYTQVVPKEQVANRLAEVKVDDFKQEFNVPLFGTMGSLRRETNATGRTITTMVRGGVTANGASMLIPVGAGARIAGQGGVRIIQVLGSTAVIPALAGAE